MSIHLTVSDALTSCAKLTDISIALPHHTATFSHFITLLESASCNSLENMTLYLYQYPNSICSEPDATAWARLDKALQDSRWDSLKLFNVVKVRKSVDDQKPIIWGNYIDEEPYNGESWREELQVLLPQAVSRRIVFALVTLESGDWVPVLSRSPNVSTEKPRFVHNTP